MRAFLALVFSLPVLAACHGSSKDDDAQPEEGNDPASSWWAGWSMDDPRLSQPIYNEFIDEKLPLTLRDGVVLDIRVVRPVTGPGVIARPAFNIE